MVRRRYGHSRVEAGCKAGDNLPDGRQGCAGFSGAVRMQAGGGMMGGVAENGTRGG